MSDDTSGGECDAARAGGTTRAVPDILAPALSHRLAPILEPFSGALAPLLAVASMCSVQLGAALSRPVMIEYGAPGTTWLRLCCAALALAVVARPPFWSYSRQRWLAALALGSAMACMTLCFFEAVRQVPLGLAVAIDFLGPLAVALSGVRKPAMLAWPALAAVGVLLLARRDGIWVAAPAALVFPLGAALGWAAYILLMKRVGALFDGLQGLATSLIVAALVATPFGLAGLVQGGRHFPSIGQLAGQLIDAAYLAALVPLFPYVLELIALRRMRASTFGILMSAEPAIAAVFGFIVLAQPMSALQIVGTLCVVGASVGTIIGANISTNIGTGIGTSVGTGIRANIGANIGAIAGSVRHMFHARHVHFAPGKFLRRAISRVVARKPCRTKR